MDPNTLRQLGFFTVPNNQTVNPVDQTFGLIDGQANQSGSLWDTHTATRDQGFSGSTPAAPSGLSLDFLLEPDSTAEQDRGSARQPGSAQSSVSGQHRRILPTRPPRTRDGHERKRSKLSTDATPFDSVDYWMQFDTEDNLADIPESVAVEVLEHKSKDRQPQKQRSMNASRMADATRPSTAARVDEFNDSALDDALSDDEDFSGLNLADQLSQIDTMPPTDIPEREGLYSTPLSWERPEPGIRMDQLIGFTPPSMNEAEQRRLIAIAMNPGPSMGGLGYNFMYGMNSGFSTPTGSGYGGVMMGQETGSAAARKPTATTSQARPEPKRQASNVSEKGRGINNKAGDRAAHNDIERKYRTNLKDRIAELKSAVPALAGTSEDAGEDDDEPSQPGKGSKVSKGTVLTKATEYIHQLEKRNKQIMTEHQTLSRRLQAFEQLLAAQARPVFRVPDYSRTLFDPRAFC